jgi:hypothetical protein
MIHSCSQKLSIAAALSLGVVYSIKTLIMKFAPEFAMHMKAAVWHKPLEVVQQMSVHEISIQGFLMGLIVVMVWAYVIVSLTSCFYNYLEHGKHKK